MLIGALSGILLASPLDAFLMAAFGWLLLAAAAVDYRTAFIPIRLSALIVGLGLTKTGIATYQGKLASLWDYLTWSYESGWGELIDTLLITLFEVERGGYLGAVSGVTMLVVLAGIACVHFWIRKALGRPLADHPLAVLPGGDILLPSASAFLIPLPAAMAAFLIAFLSAGLYTTVAAWVRRRPRPSRVRLGPWLAPCIYIAAWLTLTPYAPRETLLMLGF